MFDPAPDEPEELSPEDRWGDPERDLARVPEAPSAEGTDVPADVAGAFWGVFFIVKIGVLAAAIGPMLVFFEGEWMWGGGLFVLGVLAFVRAYSRYRAFKRSRDEGDGDTSVADGADENATDGDASDTEAVDTTGTSDTSAADTVSASTSDAGTDDTGTDDAGERKR